MLPLSVDHFTQNGNIKNISHIDATVNEINEDEKDVTQKPAPKVSPENFELEISLGKSADLPIEKKESKDVDEPEDDDEYRLFTLPRGKGCIKQIMWLTIWPIHLVYWLTIPNCERGRFKNLFPITFLMCIIWIGSLSYLVAWMITIVGRFSLSAARPIEITENATKIYVRSSFSVIPGDTLKIPDSVMGITFLAAGTSVPEAVSSVIVAKQGMISL